MRIITESDYINIANYIMRNSQLYGDDWNGKTLEELTSKLKSIKINLVETEKDFYTLKGAACIAYYCKRCGDIYFSPAGFRIGRIPKYSKFLCFRCLKKQTFIDKYGVDNPMKNKEIVAKGQETWNNKSKEEFAEIQRRKGETRRNKPQEEKDKTTARVKLTKKERYGDEHYNNPEKNKQTMRERYNVDHPLQYKSFYNAMCEKKKERYGDPYYNNLDKRHETCQERYGKNNACEDHKVIEKINQATINKLGVKRPLQNEYYLNKFHSTMKERYGGKTTFESQVLREKANNTKLDRYGTLSLNFKGYYYGQYFHSLWELAVWIYCIDHNIPIIREPCTLEYTGPNDETHKYIPDFSINGKLVEIKGSQFFNSDGSMRFPYNKKKVNGKWILMTSDEKKYMNDLYKLKHQCGIKHGVEFWKESDCKKYIEYCNTKYPGWNTIFRKDNFYNPSYWCFNIINIGYSLPKYYLPISQQGINPYDIDKENKYHFVKDKGLTPFDIIK